MLPEIIAALVFACFVIGLLYGIYRVHAKKRRQMAWQAEMDKVIIVEYGKYSLPMTMREKIEYWNQLDREGKRKFAAAFYRAKIEQGLVEVSPGHFVRKTDYDKINSK